MAGLRSQDKRQGFTIVEVVMTLAVASTIFLVVFAAIPRLQATRRDAQRKSDYQQVFAALERYYDNSGDITLYNDVRLAFPDTVAVPGGNFVSYVSEADGSASYIDPLSKQAYRHRYVGYTSLSQAGDFRVIDEYRCNTTGSAAPWQYIPIAERTKPNLFVLVGVLEKGYYCIDNE